MALATRRAGWKVVETNRYAGQSDWLVLWGAGDPAMNAARLAQVAEGRKVLIWDMGYFKRGKLTEGYLRGCINDDHPQRLLDLAPADASRWKALGIELQELADPNGPVILVGLSNKYRTYMGIAKWELKMHETLKKRFPSNRIIFRPKKRSIPLQIVCNTDVREDIFDVLRGAALVVTHHSNVAVDATIVGVPFETEDGAAIWLAKRPFTIANRLEFLQRLAWFQWRVDEADEAWDFFTKLAR
jgi:hypothetical protein